MGPNSEFEEIKRKRRRSFWRFAHRATKAQFLSVFNNHPGSFKFKGLTSSQFGLLLLTPRNLAIICSLNRRYMQIIKRGNANLKWKRVHYGKIYSL